MKCVMLRDFRHPDIDTEVWFVALGAEEALNSGNDGNFLKNIKKSSRVPIIVNLEGVGAGQFSFIEEEGQYRPIRFHARIKRVLRQASGEERSFVRYEQTAQPQYVCSCCCSAWLAGGNACRDVRQSDSVLRQH